MNSVVLLSLKFVILTSHTSSQVFSFTESTTHCLSLITKHGGHLGFFEGGFIFPNTVTWCDKAVLQFANAIVSLHKDGKLQKSNMHAEKENGFTH